MSRCKGTNKKGGRCGSNALPNSEYCSAHQKKCLQEQRKFKCITDNHKKLDWKKYCYLMLFVIISLPVFWCLTYLVSRQDHTYFNTYLESPKNYYIRNMQPFSPEIEIHLDFESTKHEASLRGTCVDVPKAAFEIHSCKYARAIEITERSEKLKGVTEKFIYLGKEENKWKAKVQGNPFWFPFDKYTVNIYLQVPLYAITINQSGFKHTLTDNWEDTNVAIKINLFRPLISTICTLLLLLLVSISGYYFVWNDLGTFNSEFKGFASFMGILLALCFGIREVFDIKLLSFTLFDILCILSTIIYLILAYSKSIKIKS